MIDRSLRIALAVSLGAHILAMSAVAIVTPGDIGRTQPYQKVNFLGPIFRKTAFDLMLESSEPIVRTSYGEAAPNIEEGYLTVVTGKRDIKVQEFPERLESRLDVGILGFLAGGKTVPDFLLDTSQQSFLTEGARWSGTEVAEERKMIYSPESPLIMSALYGGKKTFRVKVSVLVDAGGNIKKVEPLTTTGYPQLDITATKYVWGWIFEPKKIAGKEDEWLVVEVVLKARD